MEVAWELDYGATSNGWEDEVETRELILLNMIRLHVRTVDRSCALTTQAGSDWGHGARAAASVLVSSIVATVTRYLLIDTAMY